MKHLFVLFVSVFIISCNAFAKQERYIRHKVEKGETVMQLARKYKVTPFDIYKLNPDTQKGLQENAIVLIPTDSIGTGILKSEENKKEPNSITTTHEVTPKETLFGIAKKYNISVESLEKANAELVKEGLKIGQTLLIPDKGTTKSEVKSAAEFEEGQFVFHEVQAKETKYGIAKRYGITIQELEKQNPEIVEGLPLAFKLKIPVKNVPVHKLPVVATKENYIEIEHEKEGQQEKEIKNEQYTIYEVKAKETLYGLTKSFEVSETDLIALNPELKNGLNEGMLLRVPLLSQKAYSPKEYGDLTSTLHNKEKKQLVMFLPFNLSKSDVDTPINPKDKILNMTLDFYSGALMAIDSAKTLGLNINVRIFDSEETKNASDVARVISSNDFSNVDAVIGPFYKSNVETTAGLLRMYNIPVISPMSKELSNIYSNLYQSVPPPDFLKLAMLDYLKSKAGNVIAVVDPKKNSVKQLISDNYPEVQFVSFEENGTVNAENLTQMLSEEKENFVILETERSGMILNTTNILLKALSDYQIKLVTLEKNNSFEYEEISSSRLMKLNLHYPSMLRDVDLPEINSFSHAYKRKNNVYPNQYAIRGFDVTFDILVRLSQKESFVATFDDVATEQIGSRFEYHKQSPGGYINRGIYILYYDDDLTIKKAN